MAANLPVAREFLSKCERLNCPLLVYVCDRIIADIVSGGHDGKRVVLYKRQACPVD
jgi:hypothetical protein